MSKRFAVKGWAASELDIQKEVLEPDDPWANLLVAWDGKAVTAERGTAAQLGDEANALSNSLDYIVESGVLPPDEAKVTRAALRSLSTLAGKLYAYSVKANPRPAEPPFMPRRPFSSSCLDTWSEVDPASIVQEATAILHPSVVALAQEAGLPVTVLHEGSGYILVGAQEAPAVAEALSNLAAEYSLYDLQGAVAELARYKGVKGKAATAKRKTLRVEIKGAKDSLALADRLEKAAAELAPAKTNPYRLSLEPLIGPMLLTNPPPWYWPH